MKTRHLTTALFAVTAILLLIGLMGCEENIQSPEIPQFSGNEFTILSKDNVCGTAEIFTLWGGKDTDVGTVTVGNCEEFLYVTYTTKGDWYLKEVQLYVLHDAPTYRLPPGHAPYKSGGISYATTYTFEVPLSKYIDDFEKDCNNMELWLQAHAAVVEIVDDVVVKGETAYCGDICDPSQGAWYGNAQYIVQCCDEETCYDWIGETAWAKGDRYVARGNWAMYTEYKDGETVDLIAGQQYTVGSVTFSEMDDGKVEIKIVLSDDWELKPETGEAVKIQGYSNKPPARNPAPGKFTTYKGNELTIMVDHFDYYGIHLDVGYWHEVECTD